MMRIVVDGAADMPNHWEEEYQINLLPLRVNFGDETYLQGSDFKHDDFYRLVKEKRMIPKTTLPSIGQVTAFYRQIAEKGDTILSIHITRKLSGTFATVQAAAEELSSDYQIYVYDSGGGSAVQGFMAREARLMDRAGASVQEILERLESIRQQMVVIFTLDTLEFAYLNGRINALQNLFTSALQVKPIILLKDGLLEVVGKVRTRQRALEHVVQHVRNRFGDRCLNIAIVHAEDASTAQEILQRVKGLFQTQKACLIDLAIPVAANLGPRAIGLVAYPVEEER